MSRLMDQAIQEARLLPEADQEAIASIILQGVESDRRWDELFSRPGSADLLSRMADQALSGIRSGRAQDARPRRVVDSSLLPEFVTLYRALPEAVRQRARHAYLLAHL